MSAFRDAKAVKVAEIKEKIEKASSFVLVDYKGLTVAEDTALRNEFRKSGVSYHVYKNRLMKIALNELGYTQFDDALNGPTAIAMGTTDIAAPAKIAMDKAKAYKKMSVKCGFVDGKYLDEEGLPCPAEKDLYLRYSDCCNRLFRDLRDVLPLLRKKPNNKNKNNGGIKKWQISLK